MRETDVQFLPCPCCGYKTVRGEYDICPICRWETETDNPDDRGMNEYTLRQAQENYRWFGATAETYAAVNASLMKVRPPTEEEVRTREWTQFAPALKGDKFYDPNFPIWNLTCPCCGYITIHGGWERCEICGWFFDPQQYDPDNIRGPNEVSLRQAQRNYQKYEAKSEVLRPHVRQPSGQDRRDSTWKPLSTIGREALRAKFLEIGDYLLMDVTCPCCGHKAVSARVWNCQLCGWEYYTAHQNPYDRSQPNPTELLEAQWNYLKHGVSRPEIDRAPNPLFEELKDSEWNPLDELNSKR